MKFKQYFDQLFLFFALVVIICIFYLLNPNFLKTYNLVSMCQSVAPYLLMGLGVTFVIASGGIDLSIGTTCIACATVAGKICIDTSVPFWLCIPIMVIVGTLFGALNGFLIAKLKLPSFIATLGTMMFGRGISAIFAGKPNILYPSGSWLNQVFSYSNGLPTGIFWCVGITIIAALVLNKNKIGRYLLAIGSNEEATRLSGIDTVKYKFLAYVISGMSSGVAAVFWAASFPTIQVSTGNGMELDAIAGVLIGGTSSAGGSASILGTAIGSVMLIVIRSGINFVLARVNLNINATYATYCLTGIIVVLSVLFDVLKTRKTNNSDKGLLKTIRGSRKKYVAIIAVVVAFCLTVGALHHITKYVVQHGEDTVATKGTIYVVAKGETHAFWLNVKRGCEDAAKLHGYSVVFRGPKSEAATEVPAQLELARTGLSNGAKALILATNGDGFADLLMECYNTGVPVVGFDCGIGESDVETVTKNNKNPIVSDVQLNNNNAGANAADNFYRLLKEEIAANPNYNVGVIQHDINFNGYGRADGFVDRLTELVENDPETKGHVTISVEIKTASDSTKPYVAALEALYEKGVNAIFMTNEGVVTDVCDAVNTSGSKYDNIKFFGFDAGDKQKEWMVEDSGKHPLIGSIAQDSYAIGYAAVINAIKSINGEEVEKYTEAVSVFWDENNMEELVEQGIVYGG